MMIASQTLPLLLADWLQTAIGITVFVFYLIGQLMSLRQEAKPKPRGPHQAAPHRPAAGEDELILLDDAKPAQRPVPDQAESLRREIDDFVRRAQGKPPRQPEPTRQPKPKRPVRTSEVRQPRRPQPAVRPTPTLQPRNEGVKEHVSKHIDTSDISQHAEQLGHQLGQTDERVESRLHEKFDHKLGSLKREESPVKPEKKEKPDVTADIAAMLSHPDGMRQLIIANEILRRPEW